MVTTPGISPSTTCKILSIPFSAKYNLKMSNLCDTLVELNNCYSVTCVCVNALRTILHLTLVTHGQLLSVKLGATKRMDIPFITHNILLITVLLCMCKPYMCRHIVPRTMWRVLHLSSNQKLLQVQEYTQVLMQITSRPYPYLPYYTPMPHARKQFLNVCPTKPMKIIVLLLPIGRSLSTNKWPCHMEALSPWNPCHNPNNVPWTY